MGKNCTCQCNCQGETDPFSINSKLLFKDHWAHIKARFGINRMGHQVAPGLYRLGTPEQNSPVIVTANYKLTFDEVRFQLKERSCWILVLNTRGVNVWCAAGKGSFGTYELCKRINECKLHELVNHRQIILPQLGAVGIKAQAVTQDTGFHVLYGPVYAKDLLPFIDTKIKTEEMSRIHFSFKERLILTPIEITGGLKTLLSGLLIIPFTIFAITHSFADIFPILIWWLGSYLAGSFFFPLLLPLFPWKSFTLSGIFLGICWTLLMANLFHFSYPLTFILSSWAAALSGYLAFNFTGATTFTCPSGVEREIKWAFPTQITFVCLGCLAGLFSLVKEIWF